MRAMNTTTRLAWKNIRRNKTRSVIFITAAVLGVALAVLSLNLMKTISTQRLEDSISIQTGHLQIHKPGFTDNYEVGLHLDNEESITKYLTSRSNELRYAKRQVINAMLASPENSIIGTIKGVIPEKEKQISVLQDYLVKGSWFENKGDNPILISRKTAEKLGLQLDAKVIITVSNIHDELEGAAFRVCGIYETPNAQFDEQNAFVQFDDLSQITGTSHAHEIAIRLNNEQELEGIQEEISGALKGNLQVRDWKQLLPELYAFSGFTDLVSVLFTIIILLGLGFGLLNTMNMIVQERTREIGMLRAIGQSEGAVFQLLLKESGIMMFIGAFIGVVLGVAVVLVTNRTGLNLGDGLGTLGIRSTTYPRIFFDQLIMLVVLTFIITLIISILPASRAYKIEPSKALKDL